MSEEIIMTEAPVPAEDKMPGFKRTCFGIGIMMITVYVSRILVSVVATLIAPLCVGLSLTALYIIDLVLSVIFLNAIPITVAYFVLKPQGMFRKVYTKPAYFGSAMGMFPAMYGVAILANLLTVFVASFFKETSLNDSFTALEGLQTTDLSAAIILFVQLVVVAPICEELWFRGIVMESLRPYGNGFAIFASALLFGFTHANLQQFLYTTVIGIFLGYLAIATKSIVTTTIIHAILNSISGIMILMGTNPDVQEYLKAAETPAPYDPVTGGAAEFPLQGMAIVYVAYLFVILMLMIIGIIMAIYKLTKIRRYRVEKVWDVSTGKRWGVFFSRVTVIIMLLFAIDAMTFNFIANALCDMISGAS